VLKGTDDMNRPMQSRFDSNGRGDFHSSPRAILRRRAYTLIEILVSTTLSLMLMAAVISMFGEVGKGITDSRSMLESADRLRVVETRLQQDLAGVTVTMNPPCRPEDNAGYFEYIEGPVSQATASNIARDTTNVIDNTLPDTNPNRYAPDTTVGDFDDILMFTTRSTGRPFVGKVPIAINASGTIQSDVAEVAWFLRGRTLYRRVLLVAPELNNNAIFTNTSPTGFYANYDVSARPQGTGMIANTLGDLTRRECRYAHDAINPFFLTGTNSFRGWGQLGLPTLRECSYSPPAGAKKRWTVGWVPQPPSELPLDSMAAMDFWTNDSSQRFADNYLMNKYLTDTPNDPNDRNYELRIADDVVLTNVVGFDVKAWDPRVAVEARDSSGVFNAVYHPSSSSSTDYITAFQKLGLPPQSGLTYSLAAAGAYPGAYMDLGYGNNIVNPANAGSFGHFGDDRSGLDVTINTAARTYDTYSTTCESADASNGFDDGLYGANGIVDDTGEKVHVVDGKNCGIPPYPHPLRGIQVKIRVFEPDSRQIREVTVVQDFLPQ
jgi:type II secretory pathway component PulJ